jgi:hypothetical protein
MSIIGEQFKSFLILIGATALIALIIVLSLLFLFRSCGKPGNNPVSEITEPGNDYRLPERGYTKPSVRIPFIKPKTPVSHSNLPIPTRMITKSVTITTPGPGGRETETTLIMDTNGRVYKTKDTPESVRIEAVEWKRPVFEVKPKLAYSLVWAGNVFNCLSVDLLRIWRIHAGCDVGMDATFRSFLIGLAGRFEITENMKLLAGRDFLGSRYYAGVQFSF